MKRGRHIVTQLVITLLWIAVPLALVAGFYLGIQTQYEADSHVGASR